MARIERKWLERIPDYLPLEIKKRRRSASGGEEWDSPPGDGDDLMLGEGDEDEDESGEPDDNTESSASGEADDAGEDEESGDGESDRESDMGEGEFDLRVPKDVEERRREEAEKRRRTGLNRGYAHQSFSLEGHFLRNLATRFARMISKVAEDSADMPSQGDEEWDYSELLKRRFTGRLISQCRMTREKRKVAVVLDTSPSCEHQARLFGTIARIAEALGDCELFDAPNFYITARKTGEEWERLSELEREWQFKGRVVLAFGDFDGIERICQASAIRGNKIYWFCCEERPSVLESNREFFVQRFKGNYFPATHLNQLMIALRRVR